MIVSFCGVQSSGKSTLLNELMKTKESWSFEPEITRSLKAKYGLSINENGDDFTQLFVLNSHLENIFKHTGDNVVLDRCIIDGYLYTQYLFHQRKVSDKVIGYAEYLHDKLISKYDVIFYTGPDDCPITDDKVRSIDIDFRNEMIDQFEHYFKEFKTKIVRVNGTVEERLKIIKKAIKI